MYTMTSKDAAATMGAGRRLAALVRPGDVITLSGQLGAGKTTFAAGFGEGLGIDEPVTSPSFVLVRTYRSGFTPLVHVDAYRLGSLGEFEDLDVLDEASEGVLLIEWGEAVVGVLPEDHLRIHLAVDLDEAETRTITFHPSGGWMQRPLEEVTE
ncbi:MAG: tRNA (adenosine(37)-N6)-threonylcarbamoyltransferase complex ATPase subunit type 1 TsaE [Acidimicrobiia bacterium]|nr:tRNA (adenosine(37)-N6)-threonylcarbamoyltransferase complex ATPase subunit type 1 TsaE [Acidimicrobiia bacterium]MDH5505383.1 tRNA (adenosine(37)-N6)-threonylcarbamoyltransferase complex ATPase subunit type 1 TsaE [Acidimicrobiia bacterium]